MAGPHRAGPHARRAAGVHRPVAVDDHAAHRRAPRRRLPRASGVEESTGGRPAELLEFDTGHGVILVADLGGNHARAAVVGLGGLSADGQPLAEEHEQLKIGVGPEAVLDWVDAAVPPAARQDGLGRRAGPRHRRRRARPGRVRGRDGHPAADHAGLGRVPDRRPAARDVGPPDLRRQRRQPDGARRAGGALPGLPDARAGQGRDRDRRGRGRRRAGLPRDRRRRGRHRPHPAARLPRRPLPVRPLRLPGRGGERAGAGPAADRRRHADLVGAGADRADPLGPRARRCTWRGRRASWSARCSPPWSACSTRACW